MSASPWSARLASDRLDALRRLVTVRPDAYEPHPTAQTAHYMLARALADIPDFDEASISAIVATLPLLWEGADEDGDRTLAMALARTLQASLSSEYVRAMLAGAVIRSHETLSRMEQADTQALAFGSAEVETQRRDAAMTMRAFCAWELAAGFAPPGGTDDWWGGRRPAVPPENDQP